MNKRQAKRLVWSLTEGCGRLNMDLWHIYYRPNADTVKFLKERHWQWQVVLIYEGILLFRQQIKVIERQMIVEEIGTKKNKLHKFPYSIDFKTREIIIW